MIIHVLRHCEAEHNVTKHYGLNTQLTDQGITQAKTIVGDYDYVICSPLRRCKDTLLHSQLIYSNYEECDLIREYIKNTCDMIYLDEQVEEDIQVLERIEKFKEYIKHERFHNKKILIITHLYIILYMTGRHVLNGEIMDITNVKIE